MRRPAIILVGLLALAGCDEAYRSDDNPGEIEQSGADSVEVSVEETPYGDYLCFRYTTVDRGGLWCDRLPERAP